MQSSITCTRRLEFDAAHRVLMHEGKCKHLHGHRYVAEITCGAAELDALGRVVDFSVIKDLIGAWIDENWDHTCILWQEDAALAEAVHGATGQAVYIMPCNPTAENMARYLLEEVCPALLAETGVQCIAVKLWETPNCWAQALSR